jgi:hypothetical protein
MESLVFLALIVIGGLYCFFGYKIFMIILWICGFIIFAPIAAAIGFGVSEGDRLVAVISGLIGGCIGGGIAVALYFLGVFLIGAACGALTGAFLSSAAGASPHPALLLPLAVIGGIAAIAIQKFVIILSTAFLGSFYIVAGILFFAVRYDPQRVLQNPSSALGGTFYVALLCWILLGIFGVCVQYVIGREKDDSVAGLRRHRKKRAKAAKRKKVLVEPIQYETMTRKELLEEAKAKGHKGVSKHRKAQLIDLLAGRKLAISQDEASLAAVPDGSVAGKHDVVDPSTQLTGESKSTESMDACHDEHSPEEEHSSS